MKLLRPLVLLALAAIAPSTARAAEDAAPGLALGQPAPLRDVRMPGVDGRAVAIADVAGKQGTLVIFMCQHCPWVKAWQTRIARVGKEAIQRGVGVIAINSNDIAALPEDDLDHMAAQARQLGLAFPYVMDSTSDVARAFGATHTPEAYLFDARGRLVYHGAVDDNARDEKRVKQRWLRDAVEAVAGGRAVPVAETKAMGCGIRLRAKVQG